MRSIHPVLAALVFTLASPALAQSPELLVSPWDDCAARALAVLDGAQRTVDVAQYNIRDERFVTKLAELRARGVRVRVCVDQKNAVNDWNTLDDRMEAEGFDLLRVRNDRGPTAIMHHKFTVVDGELVMTGSFNWNETAEHVNDENMLVIRDAALAAAYTAEFEELRGAPDVAGPGQGAGITVHFSPEDRPRDAIVAEVRRATRRIIVCMFTYTDGVIARAMRDAARRGVEVLLVIEQKQAINTTADETVATGGPRARVLVVANTASAHSAMHQKFAVFDDERVVTGACNWTRNGFDLSNEDLLVIQDRALADRYVQAAGDIVARYVPAGFDPAAFGIDRPEVRAHFTATVPDTRPGETVLVVGSHPALGAWDPARGVPLATTGSLFPSWGGRAVLPRGATVAWKLVIVGPDGVRWEEGDDRLLTTDPRGAAASLQVTFRAPPPPVNAPAPTPVPPTNGLVGGLPGS